VVYLQPIRNPALEGGWWSAPRFGRFTPGEDTVPLLQEVGSTWKPVWTAQKVSPPPEFDPRPVQLVASQLYRLSYPRRSKNLEAISIF
jgi:hypothetical protein